MSECITVLETNPFIGRSVQFGLRELIVGEGSAGSVVLYEVRRPLIRVLAIRQQRERGLKRKPQKGP